MRFASLRLLVRRSPILIVLSLVLFASLTTSVAHAELEFISDDAAELWPGSAPVRTSAYVSAASTRGVRGNRLQYQTFEVTEAFSLDKLLLEYEWVGGTTGGSIETNFVKVKLYEIERTYDINGLEDSFTLGNVVIPQVSFLISPLDKDGQPKVTTNVPNSVWGFYAIELAWNPEISGELILPSRTGNQGYALEINGTHDGAGSSVISLIERSTNPYPPGRAYEFIGTGQTGPFGTGLYDFPMVLTAVPEPEEDGDFNEDGTVDAADYVAWRKTNAEDLDAYNDWVRTFGMSGLGGGSGNSPAGGVPEPVGLIMLLTAACISHLAAMRRCH